jgi:RimJ/RimL family protein N-acetyltransferase
VELRPEYPVRSARTALRPLSDADVAALVLYRARPDVCRWVPFEPMSAEEVARASEDARARTALDAEGQTLTLGVEVGYVFNPDFAGNCYATVAVHTLLHLAFDELGLYRVTARVDQRNHLTAELAARLGMRQEANLVKNEWFKGKWSDELDLPLLEEEWSAQHRTTVRAHG